MPTPNLIRFYREVANVTFFHDSLLGVVDDVLKGTFPPEEMLMVTCTVGEAATLPHFWADEWFVAEMVSCLQARLFRMLALKTLGGPELVPLDVFNQWMTESERDKPRIAKRLMKPLAERFGTEPADDQIMRAFQKRFEAEVMRTLPGVLGKSQFSSN